MKIQVMAVGKPRETFIAQGVEHYRTRLRPLLPVEWVYVPETGKGKNLSVPQRKELEGEECLRRVAAQDVLILLDERGKQHTSEDFSAILFKSVESARGKVIFLIGGPYGTSEQVQKRADRTLSLSDMTFTHEMALLLLTEQLYRAVMIRNGSKYHHR